MKKFNINEYVWVKLTDLGKKHWENDFNKYPVKGYDFITHYNSYTESNGYTKFQLHVLMELFGEKLTNGFANMFETNILLEEEKLEEI